MAPNRAMSTSPRPQVPLMVRSLTSVHEVLVTVVPAADRTYSLRGVPWYWLTAAAAYPATKTTASVVTPAMTRAQRR